MIRAATLEDVESITAGGVEAFQRAAISQPDPMLARAMARGVIARGLALVAIDDAGSRIVGSIGLVKRTWDHSGLPYLTDRWTYALDGAGHAFADLVTAARQVSGKVGLPLYLGVYGVDRWPAISRLYRMAGGWPVAELYAFAPLAEDERREPAKNPTAPEATAISAATRARNSSAPSPLASDD